MLEPVHKLSAGTRVMLAGVQCEIRSRRGSDDQPILTLDGVGDREAAQALGGELVLVEEVGAPLAEGEWLAEELIGCEVPGLGAVVGLLAGPSCDVIELSNGTLIPLVRDAVRDVDLETRTLDVDRGFLGLEEPGG